MQNILLAVALDLDLDLVFMMRAAMLLTTQMLNECFEEGVVSEPRMASAGVEPWMGSSTD